MKPSCFSFAKQTKMKTQTQTPAFFRFLFDRSSLHFSAITRQHIDAAITSAAEPLSLSLSLSLYQSINICPNPSSYHIRVSEYREGERRRELFRERGAQWCLEVGWFLFLFLLCHPPTSLCPRVSGVCSLLTTQRTELS